MPRASGNDLCEIFGYAPDDISTPARKQWRSQQCPFIGGTCIKHSHPQLDRSMVVYGSCSVTNKRENGDEEVVICPQRLYATDYATLKACIRDATGSEPPVYLAAEYSRLKRTHRLPRELFVLLGHNSGREMSVSRRGVIERLSLDWVMVHVVNGTPTQAIPCEVQSIDTTGNYRDNWEAYSREGQDIPDSEHGMNWANVWKRLIPQLILKGALAATSRLCAYGLYFVLPDRVYVQFERIVGSVQSVAAPGPGVLSIMTYSLGPPVPHGSIRTLEPTRVRRMLGTDFAQTFAAGAQVQLGEQLDLKIVEVLGSL